MRAELVFSLDGLLGFLLTLARVAGAFVFVPLPGFRSGPEIARIVLALSLTLALLPAWPRVDAAAFEIGRFSGWLICEAALGIAVGLAVGFLTECFVMAAQIMGLQGGYAYASMIDPNTQADSGVLLIVAQLGAGLLFFASGLDREVIRTFALSLESWPPGSFMVSRSAAETIARLGGAMFSTGLRLALPVVALLMMIDLALALLGRLNAHLQMLTLAFPVKMLATLGLLAWMAVLFPIVYRGAEGHTLSAIRALFVR